MGPCRGPALPLPQQVGNSSTPIPVLLTITDIPTLPMQALNLQPPYRSLGSTAVTVTLKDCFSFPVSVTTAYVEYFNLKMVFHSCNFAHSCSPSTICRMELYTRSENVRTSKMSGKYSRVQSVKATFTTFSCHWK